MDDVRGWLLKGVVNALDIRAHFDGDDRYWPGWLPGVNNYRVIYTAGYATVPEDVQEACAEWVAALFWQSKENPAVYPGLPTGSVALVLDYYRRHTAGRP